MPDTDSRATSGCLLPSVKDTSVFIEDADDDDTFDELENGRAANRGGMIDFAFSLQQAQQIPEENTNRNESFESTEIVNVEQNHQERLVVPEFYEHSMEGRITQKIPKKAKGERRNTHDHLDIKGFSTALAGRQSASTPQFALQMKKFEFQDDDPISSNGLDSGSESGEIECDMDTNDGVSSVGSLDHYRKKHRPVTKKRF